MEQTETDRAREHERIIADLFATHYSGIHRLAASILNDAAEADDAAQEIFIKAHAKLHTFRGDAAHKTWLYRIAINLCRSRLRKRKSLLRVVDMIKGAISAESTPQTTPSPESTTVRNEEESRLWAAVDTLSEKHRLPIILRYVHDCNAREIADMLDISEGTVYSRIHYAHRQLKAELTAHNPELSLVLDGKIR